MRESGRPRVKDRREVFQHGPTKIFENRGTRCMNLDDCSAEEALLPHRERSHSSERSHGHSSGTPPGQREVTFGDNQPPQLVDGVRYAPNIFVSAKYTVASFVPLCLFAQFRRVANVYFLF